MLRKKNDQMDFSYGLLPLTMTVLRPELAAIDQLLDDERFFKPFEKIFSKHMGRPSIPIETYLRMMYLKFRRQVGYEVLTEMVEDSIQYRLFCRLSLRERAPDPSTLEKLTVRVGEKTIEQLNRMICEKLAEAEKITGTKLRIDTTAVEANIHYPTDTTLLGDCLRVIRRGVKKMQKLGARVKVRDRLRCVKKILQNVGRMGAAAGGRSKERLRNVLKKMVALATATITETSQMVERVKKTYRTKKETIFKRTIETVEETVRVTKQIIAQTIEVIAGNTHIPDRLVSIFDQNARAIVRGKAHKPVEFGYKLLLQESDGIITGYAVLRGNPNDATLLEKICKLYNRTFVRAPEEMSMDCGFSSQENESILQKWGVKRICMPRRGLRDHARRKFERQSWYRRLRKFQAGMEGRNSVYKRVFGGARSLFPGYDGTQRWVGWGIFSHNLRSAAGSG